MSILINKDTKVLVQAITGNSGRLQTKAMLDAGTNIVAGVTPGKGGQEVFGIPVYNYVSEAKKEHDFNAVICFVPPAGAKDSCFEAIDAGIDLLVLTTEEMALADVTEVIAYAKAHNTTLIGPGCAGVIAPGVCKVGAHPIRFFKKGNVGVVSKSGALSYEIGKTLSDAGIGQSSVVAIGGGPLWGFTQKDAIERYEQDPETKVIVLLGEIGGGSEEAAAAYIKAHVTKPVVALIVGRNAPTGKSLGHAGAIVSGNVGTAATKIQALTDAGAHVVKNPRQLVETVRELLEKA
ncbi:MAG: succinate--CoA ligase subunit alpha [Oscillospiraceae bacterium]